jgi:hypothetical protein
MNQPMPALSPQRRNGALWTGLALLLLAIASNAPALYTFDVARSTLPWLSLLLPALGLVFCLAGLKRAFGQPQVFRGKIGGSILTLISVCVVAFSAWLYVHARAVPGSTRAPQIGQKVPEFALTDTGGQSVSLSQLLSTPIDAASGKAPKAVLLVFYRGYW